MVDVPRRVATARIIGVMQRDAPKLKMFMVSVIWSNEGERIIYRLFQDFKKFHRQLKRGLAFVDPIQGIKRRIPKFRTRAMRSSLQQKGRSVSRMKFLSSYLTELMRCDPIVIESAELMQFFMPRNHDLQPDFTKNSIMMLLSEDLSDGTDVTAGIRRGSVTYPFVTQTYRCVADYETKDTKNLPFKVTVNQKLDVLIKDPNGWWLVEHEDRRMAWFPAPYLKLSQEEDDDCVDDDDGDEEFSGGVPRAALYCAVRNYSPKKHDELSLTIGSVVELLRKSDSGWWLIRNKTKIGYVPSMHLQPYNNPRACLYNLKNKLPTSTLNLTTTDSPVIFPRGGSYYSCSHHEEHNSHSASIQPIMHGSAGTTPRLHSDSSLDGRKSSASMASDFSTFSTVSIPGSHISSTASIYSSMSSPESGFSTYSEGGRTVPDLCPVYRPRSLQEHCRNNRPGLDCSPLSRMAMSDGGRPGRDLSPTYLPHLCSCSGSSDSDLSSGSKAEPEAPRVPPRPRAQDIMSRCTTMTRKAALASKARILPRQDRAIHSR